MRYKLGQFDATGHEHIIYGDVDLCRTFEVLQISMDLLPGIETITAKIPGRAGSHYYGREIGDRIITLRTSMHAHSRDPLDIFREWRQESPAFWLNGTQKLWLDEEMYLNAMVTGETPLEFLGPRGVVDIQFTCHDPYFHGRTVEVPLKAGENPFKVMSQCETYPTIEVEGASGSVVVTDAVSGHEIVVPNTDHCTIDTENMKAYVDGRFAPLDMERTDFFSLIPGGPNDLAGVTLASGTGTLRYEELAL